MNLDTKSEVKTRVIDNQIYYYAEVHFGNINFVSPAVENKIIVYDVVNATIYDIMHRGKDFTVCPRCHGHLFHEPGSCGSCKCPCGQIVRYTGGGMIGEDRGYIHAGVFW